MTALVIDRIRETENNTVIEVSLEESYVELGPVLFKETTFTRSDGTLFSRIYERLTKASRRNIIEYNRTSRRLERAYRRGVKDTLEALRTELS